MMMMKMTSPSLLLQPTVINWSSLHTADRHTLVNTAAKSFQQTYQANRATCWKMGLEHFSAMKATLSGKMLTVRARPDWLPAGLRIDAQKGQIICIRIMSVHTLRLISRTYKRRFEGVLYNPWPLTPLKLRPMASAGLRFWRPWRSEKMRPLSKFWNSNKSIFTLKFYTNTTKTGIELQRLSKKYKNLQYLLFTNRQNWQNRFKMSPNKPPKITMSEAKS